MSRLGTCLCKTVQYEVTGEPFRYLLCYCSNCRKSSGSAFMSHTVWKPDQFKVTAGESSIRHYTDKGTGSGNPMARSFCTNCGSSLFAKPEKARFIIIHPSTIEGHETWAPAEEIFNEKRAEWLKDINFVKKKSLL